MKFEFAAVNAREKVLPDEWQQGERKETSREKASDEQLAVADGGFQQFTISPLEILKSRFKFCLHAHKRIAGRCGLLAVLFTAPRDQQIPCHRRHQSARKKVGGQHCEYDRLGERYEQIPGDSRKE